MSSTKFPKDKLLNDNAIAKLKAAFPKLSKKSLADLETVFSQLFVGEDGEFSFSRQYLSHYIRALEGLLKKRTSNPLFRIVLKYLDPRKPLPTLGRALHVPKKSFIVYIHPELDPKQQRVLLAHELGHLLVCEVLKKKYTDDPEPVATIFGVLAILDKSKFYESRCREYVFTDDWIIAEFLRAKNQAGGKLNVS